MRVLIVTGIYPPDIGGPATHARDLRRELRARGHDAFVMTLGDGPTLEVSDGVARFPRHVAPPVRMAKVAAWIGQAAKRFDVVYATGLHAEAVVGARMANVPSVVKVVGDPVWERARRRGLTDAGFEDFLAFPASRDPRVAAMRWMRDGSLRRASAIVTPSRYLERVVETWLGGPSDVTVIPNGVGVPSDMPDPARHDDGPLRLIYVGRLVPHKRVERLAEAVAGTEGWTLEIIGSGPERARLESAGHPRVRFAGEVDHEEILRRIAQSDALALASDYEGQPHVVIEALAVGTPVIAPPVGGVPEMVSHEDSGLLLADASVEAISRALARLRDEEGLRARLREGASKAGRAWRFEATADGVLAVLERVRRPKPRLVFVGKTRTPRPGRPGEVADSGRWEALVRHAEPVVVGVGRPGRRWVGRIEAISFPDLRPPALGGAIFYALAPAVGVAKAAMAPVHAAVVCQSPYEAVGVVGLARTLPRSVRPRVVVEIHGDWRTATRLYGSPGRRLAAPIADRAAGWALLHADVVRAVGDFTAGLARDAGYGGDVDVYAAFGDLERFIEGGPSAPVDRPDALFVGALEASKSVDVLLEAWRYVVGRVPGARLTVAGSGTQQGALLRQVRLASLEGSVRFTGAVGRDEVRRLLDACRLLVLPSRSEGMGRVILEAFARARPVVASRVGGIPELIQEGVTGRLVAPEDPEALAKALVGILEDGEMAADMGREARSAVEGRDPALNFEAGIARLAAWAGR